MSDRAEWLRIETALHELAEDMVDLSLYNDRPMGLLMGNNMRTLANHWTKERQNLLEKGRAVMYGPPDWEVN